ncbi:MAG: glycosyltransferase [Candidatus Gastranaerophilales bacterium]|nr:glycosyltransferase [Candidatus Gastranaerophilales bacterium]
MNDLVSIIIPVYNVEKYLTACLESVVNQDYKNVEVILVNDGSSDGSPEICDKYASKDNRIIVIHKGNSGVSSARNEALKVAKGKYVTFVDSDDLIRPNMIDRLVDDISTYSADIAVCGTEIFYEKNYPDLNKLYSNDKKYIYDGEDALKDLLYQKNITNALHGKLYKKSLFDDANFSEDLAIGEDLYINYQLFSVAKKIVRINDQLYLYLQREGSAINSSTYKKRMSLINKLLDIKPNEIILESLSNRIFMEVVFTYLDAGGLQIDNDDLTQIKELIEKYRKNVMYDHESRLIYKIYAAAYVFGFGGIKFINKLKNFVKNFYRK